MNFQQIDYRECNWLIKSQNAALLLNYLAERRYNDRSRSRLQPGTGFSPQTTLVRRITHG
jgi:hypothetical protein